MGDQTDHLSRHEFACRCGCGFEAVDLELVSALEACVQHFEKERGRRLAIIINSGCRCEKRNKDEGGSSQSKHTKGIAADFRIRGVHADKVADYLETKYRGKYGIGRYKGRTHLDVRRWRARWDKR